MTRNKYVVAIRDVLIDPAQSSVLEQVNPRFFYYLTGRYVRTANLNTRETNGSEHDWKHLRKILKLEDV